MRGDFFMWWDMPVTTMRWGNVQGYVFENTKFAAMMVCLASIVSTWSPACVVCVPLVGLISHDSDEMHMNAIIYVIKLLKIMVCRSISSFIVVMMRFLLPGRVAIPAKTIVAYFAFWSNVQLLNANVEHLPFWRGQGKVQCTLYLVIFFSAIW